MIADLRAIAATTLRRLASEMRSPRTAAACSGACVHFACARIRSALAETRREAVADLERLRDSLPVLSDARNRARSHARIIERSPTLHVGEVEAWAAAWEASP